MNRFLYDQVEEWLCEGSRVLDLGSGDGSFLSRIATVKQLRAEGVERDAVLVSRCVEQGLIMHHGDVLEGLDQYGSNTFDYVLLLGTFQELVSPDLILSESFRVSRRVVIAFNNFAHWVIRLQLLFFGRTPVTSSLPYEWFESPNNQFFSVLDFSNYCAVRKLRPVRQAYFNSTGRVGLFPNLSAQYGVVLLEADEESPMRRLPESSTVATP